MLVWQSQNITIVKNENKENVKNAALSKVGQLIDWIVTNMTKEELLENWYDIQEALAEQRKPPRNNEEDPETE